MRDKVVFFILGAILSTIAYSLGCYTTEISNLNADFDIDKHLGKTIEADYLRALHGITIGKMGGPMIELYVNETANIKISSHVDILDSKGNMLPPKGTQIHLVSRDKSASINSISNVKARYDEALHTQAGNLPNAEVSIIVGISEGTHGGILSITDDFGKNLIGSRDF